MVLILAPHICHMTNTFIEKNILLAPCYIYQNQKTESVLILKNNYGPFSETGIFQRFP